MSVVDRSFDHPLSLEEGAAVPLAGGLVQYGFQCGMLWGAVLAGGAQAYRLYGPGSDPEIQAILTAQRLIESFRIRNKHIDCAQITGLDWKSPSKRRLLFFFLKGGPIGCFSMAASYAHIAYKDITATLAMKQDHTFSSPVSCAAMLANKMGESEEHAVMAAGFAGGIGLSGGACGALGAAIWIIQMNSIKAGAQKFDFDNPQAADAVERFLECTDHRFLCSDIVGRKFTDIGDHAEYLHNGGCSKVLDSLTTQR